MEANELEDMILTLNATDQFRNTVSNVNYTYSPGMGISNFYLVALRVLYYMELYFTPSITIAGILGNITSVITLSRAKLKSFSSSQYLVSICLANSIYLIVALLKWLGVLGITLYTVPGLCQVMSFVENSAIFLSNWFVVAFCVDRYISFCWPAEGARLCNKARATIVLSVLSVTAVVIYINISITDGVVFQNGQLHCRPLPFPMHNLKLLLTIKGALNVLAPYACVTLLSVIMVVNVYIMHVRDSYSDDNLPSMLKKTTTTFLLVFYIFHMPYELYHNFKILRDILNPQNIASHWENLIGRFLLHFFTVSMALHLPVFASTYPLFRNYLRLACFTKQQECSIFKCNSSSAKETVEFTGVSQDESAV